MAEIDRFYAFQPTAADKDNDPLVFSIVNKPSWAAFDTAHGYLSGYPAAADAEMLFDHIQRLSFSYHATTPTGDWRANQPAGWTLATEEVAA